VAFSFSGVMNPRNNVPSRSGFDVVQSVTAIDNTTLRVRLKRRYSPIITYFFGPDQNYPILPKHILSRYADVNHAQFNSAPVGAGPYGVVSWSRGDALRLAANPHYFRGVARIPRVTLKFIPDNSTLLQQLRTHEVDAVFFADPAYLQQYTAIPGMVVTRTPIAGTAVLYFNTADPEMHDVRVRRAIVEAVDLPSVVRDATRGGESPLQAGAGLFSWAYDPAAKPPVHNVADAQALLGAAGWHRGPDGTLRRGSTPLTIHFVIASGDAESEQVGLAMQQDLRSLGISVILRKYTPVQFMAPAQSGGPMFGGRFQMAFVQILTGIDPNGLALFGCDQLAPNGFNISRYCDPVIEQAYQADSRSYDRAQRLRYLAIVQRRLAQTLPFLPIWHRRAISVYPQWLSGVDPSPISPYWNIADWNVHAR
jgi:peptide/nickel transport system substrate-binding protein